MPLLGLVRPKDMGFDIMHIIFIKPSQLLMEEVDQVVVRSAYECIWWITSQIHKFAW
jgi:hypothetical protein